MSDLDDLRIKLDQMSERLVSRLKDRSRLVLNNNVYIPDAVPISGRQGISFLEFALEGLETYHASLGRYEYTDQYPIFSRTPHTGPVVREGTKTILSQAEIRVADELLKVYPTFMQALCKEGNEPKSYGETVYIDADLIQLMHERINTIGRYVAQYKFDTNADVRQHTSEADVVRELLRDPKREEIVINKAKETAARYNLDPKVTEQVFSWLIRKTVDVEVAYLPKISSKEPIKSKAATKA